MEIKDKDSEKYVFKCMVKLANDDNKIFTYKDLKKHINSLIEGKSN